MLARTEPFEPDDATKGLWNEFGRDVLKRKSNQVRDRGTTEDLQYWHIDIHFPEEPRAYFHCNEGINPKIIRVHIRHVESLRIVVQLKLQGGLELANKAI
ncbi:hypothetical protein E5D57_007572 [Metarhizium anisopliae]|nr:hypothetical protein E5D57_007572 [Metarhizium anisopliae]